MSFTRTRAPGLWTFNSTILPGELEHIDDYSFAIDGKGGGTYAPTSTIIVGGDGLNVTGQFDAGNANNITVNNVLQVSNTGALNLIGNQNVQSGSTVIFTSGSALLMQNGSTFTQNATSTGTWSGTNTFAGTAIFNGTFTVNTLGLFQLGFVVTQATLNANAITTTGNGTGAGILSNPGVANTAAAPTKAGQFSGYIAMTGADPDVSVTPSADNPIYPLSVCRAFCLVTVGFGGPYVPYDSHNIESVTHIATGIFQFKFRRNMLNAFYSITATTNTLGTGVIFAATFVDTFQLQVFSTTTGALSGATVIVSVNVFGRR
jgi:hypothetical protein